MFILNKPSRWGLQQKNRVVTATPHPLSSRIHQDRRGSSLFMRSIEGLMSQESIRRRMARISPFIAILKNIALFGLKFRAVRAEEDHNENPSMGGGGMVPPERTW
jgi:hypothetical protein